ncbi:major allergen Ani s 1-like [Lucilia cuprina]|uniref:major allergen Ani s 1-like n=1 Tax=Lucilia cuprina TaxID=7375 RepID=UPI001F062D4D|nr:major allergen Ani s 1-like [Lucilia cuprina]
MKFIHILSLLLVALVACTMAQNCPGSPRNPSCNGQRNIGNRCRRCRRSVMWWYDSRSNQCRDILYLGSRGNDNRWCSKEICEQRCRRR